MENKNRAAWLIDELIRSAVTQLEEVKSNKARS